MYGISDSIDEALCEMHQTFLELLNSRSLDISSDQIESFIRRLIDWELFGPAIQLFEMYPGDLANVRGKIKSIKLMLSAVQEEIDLRDFGRYGEIRLFSESYSSKIIRKIRQEKMQLNTSVNLNKCVLLVINSLGAGGAERQFVNLFNFLSHRAHGFEVFGYIQYLNSKPNGKFYFESLDEKFKDHIIIGEAIGVQDTQSSKGIHFPRNSRREALERLLIVMRRLNPRLTISFLEETSALAVSASFLTGLRVLTRFGSMPSITERELSDKQLSTSATRFAVMRELSEVDTVFWGSNSARCLLSYRNKIGFRSNLRLLPNITPEPSNNICNASPTYGSFSTEKFTIISVMRLSAEKRPELFLELARSFRTNHNTQFLLIGNGPLEPLIRERLESLELVNFVWIHSTLHVGYYLGRASVYVMTSTVEGSPNSVLEASMMSLPVVVADIGGLKEIYTHYETALFVSDKNELQCYVDAVQLLLDDESLRKRIASAGYKHVSRRHGGIRTQITVEALLK